VRTIVLVALVRTATAGPVCKPHGDVLVEIAQHATRPAALPTATTRVYENGAWKTVVIDVDGKVARTDAGCLEPSQLKDIREALRAAPWKTTRSDRTCRADQPRFTMYTWQHRVRYTERTCNELVLDRDSQEALDLVSYYVSPPLDHGGECRSNPFAIGCD
jgi:hypothetical protein